MSVIDLRPYADKITQAIRSKPGIKHYELRPYCQGWPDGRLDECIGWLTMLGRIRPGTTKPKRGPAAKCYWPADEGQAATVETGNETQLQAAAREVREAKQQLSLAFNLVETAERRLAELMAGVTVTSQVVAA